MGHTKAMAPSPGKRILNKLVPAESRPPQVGPRVTAVREALDMTKAEFADTIGLDRSTLTKVEKGVAGLDIAVGVTIAALFGIGLDFLYRGDLSDLPSSIRQKVLGHLVKRRDQ